MANNGHFLLEGTISYGRFGHAIAPLGDLDNDGYPGTTLTILIIYTSTVLVFNVYISDFMIL